MVTPTRPAVELMVDGVAVTVLDETLTLLEVLRAECGITSAKDGCSPQGQCGCCTVLVDGQPRVSCVTPVRRLAGRSVTTSEGLPAEIRQRWAEAFARAGGSQCGFCTPGIICRYEGLRAENVPHDDRATAARALQAHLCRCTGWQTIVDSWEGYPAVSVTGGDPPARVPAGDRPSRGATPSADRRASIEGRSPQVTGPEIALGGGGFAEDLAPEDALVVVRASSGDWVVGETLSEARRSAGKIQGRRTTSDWGPPIAPPEGEFDVTLATSWVEPAYLETDASWCRPGGQPVSPLANGGAFGGKVDSPVAVVARQLADQHGRPVRVVWSREDTVRFGPKRPPLAAGANRDGTGVVRVARTPGIREAIHRVAPGLVVEEVDVAGPPTSVALRGAGWVEAAVLLAGARQEVGWISAPDGGEATASIAADGSIRVLVRAGAPLDEVVLRSYCVGAAHMALSWVTSESLAVDDTGEVHDLTIRSFGIMRAVDMPMVSVEVEPDDTGPLNGSDAVFAAVAAAVWIARGLSPQWPTG